MAKDREIKVGDWVRFYRNGQLVIGVVNYIRVTGYDKEILTDLGPCQVESVLEYK